MTIKRELEKAPAFLSMSIKSIKKDLEKRSYGWEKMDSNHRS